MNEIKRIQRKRTKGWKIPENTVYVGRPSRWGNPFTPDMTWNDVNPNIVEMVPEIGHHPVLERVIGIDACLRLYHTYIQIGITEGFVNLDELRGKNLACWCKEGAPCHADVLLELANR